MALASCRDWWFSWQFEFQMIMMIVHACLTRPWKALINMLYRPLSYLGWVTWQTPNPRKATIPIQNHKRARRALLAHLPSDAGLSVRWLIVISPGVQNAKCSSSCVSLSFLSCLLTLRPRGGDRSARNGVAWYHTCGKYSMQCTSLEFNRLCLLLGGNMRRVPTFVLRNNNDQQSTQFKALPPSYCRLGATSREMQFERG